MADGLQVFASAAQVVQLSYEVYKFFRNVSRADTRAKAVYKKVRRLHDVIQGVGGVLEHRKQQRGADIPTAGERQVEANIRASHEACRQLLLAIQNEIRSLTGEESLEMARGTWVRFKYTIDTQPRIQQYEQSLDTHLQTLRTCLEILQCFEHLRTQNRMDSHHRETKTHLDTHHSELLGRFGRLEREICRTNTLLGQRNSSLQPQIHNGVYNADIAVSNSGPEADLTGIRNLQQILCVAQDVHSTWEPDAESVRRVQRSVSSNVGDESDSGTEDGSDTEDMAFEVEDLGASLPRIHEDGRLHAVRDLDPGTPLPIVSRLIETFRRNAQKEFEAGNLNRAEASQVEAINHLQEREEKHGIPFSDRIEMRQFLATIYLRQNNLDKAQSIVLGLIYGEQAEGNDERSQVGQHHMLAEIYHKMYLANGNRSDLEHARQYAQAAVNKLYLLVPTDPQFLAFTQLLVDILEAQGRTSLASAYREIMAQSLSPDTPQYEAPVREPTQPEPAIDINLQDNQGITPLISAIQSRDSARLQSVLERDPDVHCRCRKNRTPLMHAVESGFELAVRRLVDRGASVNATTSKKLTALHQAASKGNIDMIELLIGLDGDIECRTKDGETPLLIAVKMSWTSAVITLLRHQADLSVKDVFGWGVLHYAVHKSAADLMGVLLCQDPKPDANCRNPAGSTPLHIAAEMTHTDAAQLLLESGADVEAQDFSNKKRTPLYLAVSKSPTPQRKDFVSLLLRYGVVVDRTRLPDKARFYDLPGPPLARSDSGFYSMGSISRRDSRASTRTSTSTISAFSRRFSTRRRNSDQ
ncbi:hypothetical protein GP486_006213 [Trichoglossum hirsutum]|uniref:Ankyrin repeat protein n=1 Tax=Trichoglossum hirsutum TaxID=265104 RepID=A0A9P8L7I6_9PEZI|nr:hypothetical protein GP486_006213 [Trichoglossum hirsutum]